MGSVISALPDRPLKAAEFTALNHSDTFALALPIDPEEAVERDTMEATEITDAIILGTDQWMKALQYDDGWRVVESVEMDDPEEERFDALQRCQQALTED